MIDCLHHGVIPLVPHLYLHFLDFEVYPDSGHVISCKLVIGEARHEAGLPRAGIPQQDYLNRIIIIGLLGLVT